MAIEKYVESLIATARSRPASTASTASGGAGREQFASSPRITPRITPRIKFNARRNARRKASVGQQALASEETSKHSDCSWPVELYAASWIRVRSVTPAFVSAWLGVSADTSPIVEVKTNTNQAAFV